MKKIIFIFSIMAVLVSCKQQDADEVANGTEVKISQPKDSTIVGADKDENG